MANPGYVRSTDGDNADNGSTWALANATLVGAAADDAAGDTIYVSNNHVESTAGNIQISWAGTLASPQKIICADDSAEPPTATATTATVSTTGTGTIEWGNAFGADYVYTYGITFSAGSGASSAPVAQLCIHGVFENCNFIAGGSGSSGYFEHSRSGSLTEYVNCGFKFANVAHGLRLNTTTARIVVKGGSILAGGTAITQFVVNMTNATAIEVDGFDFSNGAASINIFKGESNNCRGVARNCKLPASWSGSLHATTPGPGSVFEMFNCDSGDTNYRYRKSTNLGSIRDETTLVRTGGASDGTTTISWKMTSGANAEFPQLTLDTPEIVRWNDTTGSAITVTVEFLHDSATNLKDNEVWLDVMYLGTSGAPLGSFVNDGISVVATAADQTDSSETWTTTGMANPNTQKLSVTFTPAEKGFIHATVRLAKASTTVYVDPMLTVN